jgi:hypothetical protein
MSRLAGAVDGVVGVDPHRDTLAAAAGYRRLLDFARAQVPGRRCWAVERAGGYGAGLAAFLQAEGERVVESADPSDRRGAAGQERRPGRRPGGAGGLAHDHPLAPRRRGDREALRVLLATRHGACAAKVSATNQRLLTGLRPAPPAAAIQACLGCHPG